MRALLAVLVIATLCGCRVCQTCDEYPAFGGSWERTNRTSGRVGSIFDPAGAKVAMTTQSAPITTEPWNPDAQAEDAGEEEESKSLLDDLEDSLLDDIEVDDVPEMPDSDPSGVDRT